MASASIGRPATKNTCSVCLEPFKGRFPKLLPCFHTFCTPCLTELADRAAKPSGKVFDTGETEIIITCPICKRDCTVPPGGVPEFQKNFYLEQDGEEQSQSHLLPMICDLCDQGQVASHMCTNCQLKLCFHCHRSHGQCQLAQRPQKEAPALQEGDVQQFLQRGKHQMKVMERVLSVLDEDEAELHRQRKKLEDDTNHRYAEVTNSLAEARNRAMRGIKTQADEEEEKLKKKKIELRNKVDFLGRILGQGDLSTSAMSVPEVKSALLPESEMSQMEKRSRQEKAQDFFTHKISRENIDILLKKINEAVFGTVGSQDVGATLSDAGDVDPRLLFGDGGSQSLSASASTEALQQSSRMDELAKKMELLMKRMNESESQGRKTQGELNEMRAMRDKNTILAQEVAELQTKNGNLTENVNRLQVDFQRMSVTPQSSLGQTVAVNRQLETDLKSSQVQIDNILQQLKSFQHSQMKITEHGKQLLNLNAQIRALCTPVYFCTRLSQNVVTSNKRVLIFKDCDSNLGGGYNSSTGFFVAPVSGSYLFIISVGPIVKKEPAEVEIVLEGERIGYSFCQDPTDENDFDCGNSTGHCVTTVNAGQRVWLRTTNRKSSFCGTDLCWFTGTLLMPSL